MYNKVGMHIDSTPQEYGGCLFNRASAIPEQAFRND